MLKGKCEKRLKLTFDQGTWIPRLERLAKMRNLEEFDKWILIMLVGGVISQEIKSAGNSKHLSLTFQLFHFPFVEHKILPLDTFYSPCVKIYQNASHIGNIFTKILQL